MLVVNCLVFLCLIMITIIASSPHSWITRRYVGIHFATKLILFSMFLYFSLHNISSHCPQFKILLSMVLAAIILSLLLSFF
ncbi:hypothetical protein EI94DRAFT_1757687, partial [Lactarius quietus]